MNAGNQKKAVVLLSGGLDSATALAIARDQGYSCFALSLNYGQRASAELEAARRVARSHNVAEHKVLPLALDAIGGSALTDTEIDVPEQQQAGVPVTYVPARNTVFLSLALGWAEVLGARDIFVGVNAVDFSGYPDCRPEFIVQFEKLANVATRAGVEGEGIRVHAPLIELNKAQIITTGVALGVDYSHTISCYQADELGRACGVCDSCRLRTKGFDEAEIPDPTIYQPKK